MLPGPSFLDDLKRATERTAAAENDFRREIAQRIKALENERAFAFRRFNLVPAVLSRFAPVAQAMFASLAQSTDDEDTPPPDIIGTLGEFERWYGETHPNPFWILFENYIPETPVVDF